MIVVEKAYVRFNGNLPSNQNAYAAADGFDQLGVHIVPFRSSEELSDLPISHSTIVCGNIGDVWSALNRMNIPIPPALDYPPHLEWLMGRKFDFVPLGFVRSMNPGTKVFVKPVKQKLFTGFVWDDEDPRCRLSVAWLPDETPCIASQVVDFVSEWRAFIKHNTIIGVKHYKGDWSMSPSSDKLGVAVATGSSMTPVSYALDLGVTADGTTLLVEANEGYALGCYGLASIVYARFLEARWEQLVSLR